MVTKTLGKLAYPAICALCRKAPTIHVCTPCDDCLDSLARIPEPYCRDCGGTVDGVLEVCSECLANPRTWDAATASMYFSGQSRTLIHRLKYGGDVALAPMAAHLLAQSLSERLPAADFDAIVPVPLHWLRQLRRGYNQSNLVAEHLSLSIGCPILPALARRRRTRPQASLSLNQRRRNLTRAFTAKGNVDGMHLLLLDDVFTTGSTLTACTGVLRRAGARRITVATLARG